MLSYINRLQYLKLLPICLKLKNMYLLVLTKDFERTGFSIDVLKYVFFKDKNMAGTMNAIVKQKQQAIFELLDRDGDGVVSMNEFNQVLSVTMTALPDMQQIITNSLDDFFKTLNEHLMQTFNWWDDDQNGSLTWSELQNHGFHEVEIRHFLGLYGQEEDQDEKVPFTYYAITWGGGLRNAMATFGLFSVLKSCLGAVHKLSRLKIGDFCRLLVVFFINY